MYINICGILIFGWIYVCLLPVGGLSSHPLWIPYDKVHGILW
jgi:hypothetical protein